jgi:hypothetical protein
VVYDAASKESGGPSLNQCLYAGPTLTETIADIVMRFRVHKIALAGDIEKAFLMISVAEDDRNVLRFLWVGDPLKETPNVMELRFTRVTFGLSSSPFLLNATLKYHISAYQKEDPEFVERLLQSLYVDDIATGDEDEEETYQLYIKMKKRLAEGGFNTRKIVSNSKALMERIREHEFHLNGVKERKRGTENYTAYAEDDESFAKTMTGPHDSQPIAEKLLGVHWDTMEDCFIFDCKQFSTRSLRRFQRRKALFV